MKWTGFAVSMGVGLAAGAVTALMLPKNSTAHKAIQKTADAVEDAVVMMGDKISGKSSVM